MMKRLTSGKNYPPSPFSWIFCRRPSKLSLCLLTSYLITRSDFVALKIRVILGLQSTSKLHIYSFESDRISSFYDFMDLV